MRRIRRRCARRPAVRRPLDDAVPHATRPQHATQAGGEQHGAARAEGGRLRGVVRVTTAVAVIESAGRDEEAGEDDDGGIDRPQQVAGSGMQLVTVCRLEGGLFGPAPGSGPGAGPGPGPGPKRVVVACGTRRLFPARRSQPGLPCPAPELDR